MTQTKTDLGISRESARRVRVEMAGGLTDTDIQDALQSVETQFTNINATITNLSNSISAITVSAGITSASLSMPTGFTVAGSPLTQNGALTVTFATETKGTLLAGPTSGSPATPTFRVLTGSDLPNPTSTSLGGILTAAPATNNWIYQITATGSVLASQPAASNLNNGVTGSGAIVLATSPILTTPNIGSATASTVNGITLSSTAATAALVIGGPKTITFNNTISFSGTDSTSMSFPGTSDTIPGISQNNTFTGNNTFSGSATLGGAIVIKPTPVTATVYTATATDYYLEVSATAATTIWLFAAPVTGRTLMVVDVAPNAATNNITLTGNGHNIVAGTSSSTYVMNTNGQTNALTFGAFSVWKVN